MSPAHVQSLTRCLREEALKLAGEEMVLTIAMTAATWMAANNTVPAHKGKRNPTSLAAEMNERAKEEEKANYPLRHFVLEC
jgi:hypothetical protein